MSDPECWVGSKPKAVWKPVVEAQAAQRTAEQNSRHPPGLGFPAREIVPYLGPASRCRCGCWGRCTLEVEAAGVVTQAAGRTAGWSLRGHVACGLSSSSGQTFLSPKLQRAPLNSRQRASFPLRTCDVHRSRLGYGHLWSGRRGSG